MPKPSGYIVYRGPSELDGAPIVMIAITKKSTNSKTGNMVQTYILREDIHPVAAVKNGADESICGDCRHRGNGIDGTGRTCYVNLGHGPSSVYRAFQRGRYPVDATAAADACAGRIVRLGTYGDPAAVPVDVWLDLLAQSAGRTGYTHQWRTAPQLRNLVMASADTAMGADVARAMGWRTFRVRTAAQPMLARESVCPASAEAGKKLQCADCRACDGATGRKGSIAIIVHGALAKRFAVAA
jgi:hypothetical protein